MRILESPVFSHIINKIRPNAAALRTKSPAIRDLPYDTFEQSSTKTVTIKNLKGNDVSAVIKKERIEPADIFNTAKISISVHGKKLGHALIHDEINAVYIEEIATEENAARHYKGAGTELLKYIAEESKQRGFMGRIKLCAAHVPTPVTFYYKNNFVTTHEDPHYMAAIDYAVRNNIPPSSILHGDLSILNMKLDEKGAQALLNGERLYEKREFKTIMTAKAADREYRANYIEAPNEGFYLQIISKDENGIRQEWSAKGKIEKDKNREKYVQIYYVDNPDAPQNTKQFAKKAAQRLAESLGYKKARINNSKIRL